MTALCQRREREREREGRGCDYVGEQVENRCMCLTLFGCVCVRASMRVCVYVLLNFLNQSDKTVKKILSIYTPNFCLALILVFLTNAGLTQLVE